MATLFTLYKKLAQFASADGIVFLSFVKEEPEWEVIEGITPSNPNLWVSLYVNINGRRTPFWIRYIGIGDEHRATEKLVSDYEYKRSLLGMGALEPSDPNGARYTTRVGLYAIVNALLLSMATRLPWYFGTIYLVIAIFLWIYSGRGSKTGAIILWVMRLIAIGSIIAILIRLIN